MGTCWHKKPDIGWTKDSLPNSNDTMIIFETSRNEFLGVYDSVDNCFIPIDLDGWLDDNYAYKSWNVMYWAYYVSPSKQ